MSTRLNTAFNKLHATLAAQFIIGNSMGSGIYIKQSNEIFFCTARHVVYNEKITNKIKSFSFKQATARIKSYPKNSNFEIVNELLLDFRILSASKSISMNTKIDLCIILIGSINDKGILKLNKGVKKNTETISIYIADSAMIKQAKKVEIGEEAFVVGYPKALAKYNPNSPMYNYELPLVRKGIISCMNDYKTFVIDCAVYGGNSGGPVFVSESRIESVAKGGFSISNKTYLVGIVTKYIPLVNSSGVLKSVINNQNMAIPHLENSGYGVCISFEIIKQTILNNIAKRKRAQS